MAIKSRIWRPQPEQKGPREARFLKGAAKGRGRACIEIDGTLIIITNSYNEIEQLMAYESKLEKWSLISGEERREEN